jgi:hypothetical protein
MNVEIGTEAVQFPEKKCINGIFLAVKIKALFNEKKRKVFLGKCRW